MALVIDATAKGANSNSYVTVAEATAYFEGRLDAAEWTTAIAAGTEDVALVMATSRLELEAYDGTATTTTQRLLWPRYGAYDNDGNYLDSDEVPRCVKEATFELALALLKDTTLLSDTGLEGFSQITLGELSVTPRAGNRAVVLPAIVVKLLTSVRIGSANTIPIVRG